MDTGGKQLFIRFTSRYNTEVHRLLAGENYAPQVLLCSEPMPGCSMVVMDHMEGNAMFRGQFSNDDPRKPSIICTNMGLSVET